MKNGLILVASLVASFSLGGQDRQATFAVRDIQLITDTRGLDLSAYRESLASTLKSAASKSVLEKTSITEVRVVFEGTISRSGRLTKLIVISQSGAGARSLIQEAAAALSSTTFPPLPDDFVGDKLSALFIVNNKN
jgi:hypothetical protein